jgi:hypothetical protein
MIISVLLIMLTGFVSAGDVRITIHKVICEDKNQGISVEITNDSAWVTFNNQRIAPLKVISSSKSDFVLADSEGPYKRTHFQLRAKLDGTIWVEAKENNRGQQFCKGRYEKVLIDTQ